MCKFFKKYLCLKFSENDCLDNYESKKVFFIIYLNISNWELYLRFTFTCMYTSLIQAIHIQIESPFIFMTSNKVYNIFYASVNDYLGLADYSYIW